MKTARIVIGLGFGDEGKGALVDFLTAKYHASNVVRFNGGAQAAHNVITPDGSHHTFGMFGAGTLAGANTYLGPGVRVDPVVMLEEAVKLELLGIPKPMSNVWVDEDCLIVTPVHALASQMAALQHERGTTGMGVGVAARYERDHPDRGLRARDLNDPYVTRLKLQYLAASFGRDFQAEFSSHAYNNLARMLADWVGQVVLLNQETWRLLRDQHQDIVFEGAQGILLDHEHGFTPYVTSSDTTDAQARALLEGWEGEIERIGVTRLAPTRHGPGPFPTEDAFLLKNIPEAHNRDGYAGKWRVGWPDLHLLKFARRINGGIDSLAVSHLDDYTRITGWKMADMERFGDRPQYLASMADWTVGMFLSRMAYHLNVPLCYVGEGPSRNMWRRYDE